MDKKKLNEKEQANGALEGKSVYDIIGKKTFPYEEKTLDEYRKKLDAMNLSDLQNHAVLVAGIIPNVDKRDRLIDKLEREYLKKQTAYIGFPVQGQVPPGSEDIMKILSRGR